MDLSSAYKYIAINVGNFVRGDYYTLQTIRDAQTIFLNGFIIENFETTASSQRRNLFYNGVMSLAKQNMSSNERNSKLKKFLKGLIKEEDVIKVNNIIRKTGYNELLIDEEFTIRTDLETISKLNVEMINSHIEKCKHKLLSQDYSGAISNARSLLEVTYLKVIKDKGIEIDGFKGDLPKMYNQIKIILSGSNNSQTILQALGGIASITNSVASISNSNAGDRHGHLDKVDDQRLAELFVNLVLSVGTFLIKDYK